MATLTQQVWIFCEKHEHEELSVSHTEYNGNQVYLKARKCVKCRAEMENLRERLRQYEPEIGSREWMEAQLPP